MSLTGILLDVSGSMQRNIGSGTDEEGGPWVQSIFNVIDDLIEHDLTSENRVFAIGVGAECPGKEIFDVIATLQQFENTNMPATEDHINEILDILERNGARNIRNWACNVKLIQDVLSEYMATLTLREFELDKQFVKKFVDEFLPSSCRDKVQTASHAGGGQPRAQPQAQPQTQPFNLSERSAEFHSIANLRRRTGQALFLDPETAQMTFTNQGFHFQSRGAQNDSLDSWGSWGSWLFDGVLFGLRKVGNGAEDATSWTASCFKSATREDIEEVVRKAKRYFEDASRILKDIGTHSIFSVQDASRIIRGCVGEKELNELSNERKQELLENVEPFIYGGTPLYGSLEKAIKLFKGDTSKKKLLFVLSDGEPADGSIKDIARINQITSELNEAGVKTVSCFITASTNIDPKRLYDEMPPDWKPGPKFLFSLSSEVSTQHLPRAILVKRGWTIDVANNETKLFMQVNHPDNVREACKMAKDVVCSADTLSELMVSVDLDIYISQTMSDFKAKEQEEGTCYANASAAVLHLAMQRIHGREGGYPDFDELRDEMVNAYGNDGANTSDVLDEICPKYRLHSQSVCIKGAMEAIVKKRPAVARFRLTDDEWDVFRNFYNTNRVGILTQEELDVRKRPTSPPPRTFGHAVVLTSYNSKCLTFMNSWGQKWGDNGFFRVQNAEVLQLEFFDIYWTLNDLTEGEKEYYHQHGSEVAAKLVNSLKGLQKAEYTCPECKQTSLVTEFNGTLSKVQCPKCLREFSTSANAGNILALNVYLTSLSR